MPSDRRGLSESAAEDVLRRRVKAELRKRMRGLRAALPSAACEQRSARIVERLVALEKVFATARAVALFWPMQDSHEVDLRTLDAQMRARGVRVAYPSVDMATRGMMFRFVARPEAMGASALGFREPSPDDPEAAAGDLDVIVVPALAVDSRGYRIGYGAGYYDTALPRYAPPAVTVAVAYDFQLLSEVPETDTDIAVAWIVTDSRDLAATDR